MIRKLLATLPVVVLVAGLVSAAEIKSGPQAGEKIPGPFNPLNINGDDAGEKRCLVCKNGDNPVIMVFARNTDSPVVAKLIKEIDAATAMHSKCEMGSFVVFCTDDDKAEAKLKAMTDKEKYKKVILSIDNPAGPKNYKIAKDAELTVVLYTGREVKANHSFKAADVTEAIVPLIIKDVTKIVPTK